MRYFKIFIGLVAAAMLTSNNVFAFDSDEKLPALVSVERCDAKGTYHVARGV